MWIHWAGLEFLTAWELGPQRENHKKAGHLELSLRSYRASSPPYRVGRGSGQGLPSQGQGEGL